MLTTMDPEAKITAQELGPEAFTFLRSQLSEGGPLASSIDLSSAGRVWAYLPLGATSKQSADDFKFGAVFTPDAAYEVQQRIMLFISEFLQQDMMHVYIAEDLFLKLDDPPNRGRHSIFEYRGKIYHYRTATDDQDSAAAAAEELLNHVSHYPLNIFLTSLPLNSTLPNRSTIETSLAAELIANIQHVIVGAYDEEGYLIWSKLPVSHPVRR